MYTKSEILKAAREETDNLKKGMLYNLDRLSYSFIPQIMKKVSKYYTWDTKNKFPHNAKEKFDITFWHRLRLFIAQTEVSNDVSFEEKEFLLRQINNFMNNVE